MTWQEMQLVVGNIASSIWGADVKPETVGSVRCDLVIKTKRNYWVIIEVSKSSTLAKLREDLAKFAIIRASLAAKLIFCECHFVAMSEHESLIAAGQQQDVEVHTLRSFANKFLGTRLYVNERENAPFGSAVDGDGRIDQTSYTPIHYVDKM